MMICPECANEMDVQLVDDFIEGKSRECRCPVCEHSERVEGWEDGGDG